MMSFEIVLSLKNKRLVRQGSKEMVSPDIVKHKVQTF